MHPLDGARRWRALTEWECLLRLYGHRSGYVTVVDDVRPPSAPAPAQPTGPMDERPALHFVFPAIRRSPRMSGEEIRVDLLRRMNARAQADQVRAA